MNAGDEIAVSVDCNVGGQLIISIGLRIHPELGLIWLPSLVISQRRGRVHGNSGCMAQIGQH
jgi:hypothetical protein